VPEHAVHKELSQEKGSAKCHLPCSYNEESTELDRAINGTCGSLGEKLEFLPGEPMVGRSEKGNSVKSLPVKRKDETHANFHDINQNVIKTYKRRKNTNISSVDCQDRSESSRAANSKEKHVTSITQADAGLLYPAVCLSEGKILYTTSIMDGGERFKNNGVQQIPCSSEKELECLKMHLSKVRSCVAEIHNFFFPYHVMRIFYASSSNAIIFTSVYTVVAKLWYLERRPIC
jgi:hypothetical protein